LSDDLQKLVGLIQKRKFEPAVVFSFSRRQGLCLAGRHMPSAALLLLLSAGCLAVGHNPTHLAVRTA
jgi:hypothetical protein